MSIPQQKLYRITLVVLLALVLIYALAAGLRTVSDPDMGWHLATGRWVVEHHAIPSTDVLSYTASGTRWIYPPFAGVIFYLLYLARGYAAISVFCALACVATVAYLVRRRDLASLALAMCAVEPIAFRTGPRPDLFSTVFLALMLGELYAFQRGWSRRLWPLPLIMFVWANVHPGFILGLAIIGAYLLLELCDLLFDTRRAAVRARLRQAWPWLAGSAAITVLNPWGVHLYPVSLAMAGLWVHPGGAGSSTSIQELQPVPIGWHLLTQLIDVRHAENGFVCLMGIAILVIALAIWRKQPAAAILQGGALYLALWRARYEALFCIVTVIVGAAVLGEAFAVGQAGEQDQDMRPEDRPRLRLPLIMGVLIVAVTGALAVLRTADNASNRIHVIFHTESRFGVGEANWYPERAVSFIRRERLPGNIYEEYTLGGFAAWRLGPEYPDFIDGRGDPFEPTVMAADRTLMQHAPDSAEWQAAADRWGINVLLIRESAPWAAERENALGFCQSESWLPVYMDETSLVLLRNTASNRALLDRLQIDCRTQTLVPPAGPRKDRYDFWLNAGGLLFALHRDQEAQSALQQAQALYPYDPNVRMNLAQLYVRHGLLAQAETEYLGILQVLDTSRAWYELGRIYLAQQRLADAETAFSRAANRAVSPCVPYLNLARVQLLLRRPEEALRTLDRAKQANPCDEGESATPALHANIADGRSDANRMLAKLPQAIVFEQESLRLNPNVAERWYKLSSLLEDAGQMEEAQQARQKAVELGLRAP